MREEEIIKEVKGYLEFENGIGIKAIQGLLDLYQKEKQKNKELEKENNFLKVLYGETNEFKRIERFIENN